MTSKGQITVPVEIRQQLGLRPGTRVDFVVRDGHSFEAFPITGSVSDLFGIFKYDGPPSVLVRYLTRDDEPFALAADTFLSQRTSTDPAFISLNVAVETFWVLRHTYRIDSSAIARAMRALLDTDTVVFQAPDVVRRALRESEHNFADSLIAILGVDAGCDYTVTFDRAASTLPGMFRLEH